MEDLQKMYQAIEMLEQLGLPVSWEQQQALRKKENEYLENNIIPSLKDLLESEVQELRSGFHLLVNYVPEEGLSIKPIEKKKAFQVESAPTVRTSNEPYKAKQGLLKVTFPDGRVVKEKIVLKTLLEVIEYAGADRVQALGIICGNDNLVRDAIAPDEARPISIKRLPSGKYVQTNSATHTKKEQIEYINERLNLGLKVETLDF